MERVEHYFAEGYHPVVYPWTPRHPLPLSLNGARGDLLLHGTEDALVPLEQSVRFSEALHKAGVEASLIKLKGEGHEVKQQMTLVVNKSVEFFNRHLKPNPAEASIVPCVPSTRIYQHSSASKVFS